ncbi:hypothetical protein HGG76_01010 [Ochrobactrum tritici]|uniref:Amidase n=1 Tax=Brucella tritici TaxID=94626 RepID=A0A7X6FNC5_9HYPH|nr:hypothetical protein [Brucella tritici]
MSNLADLSAVELVAAYKAKSLSPVEVTEAVITRIEAYEPKLNALWAYDPDAARAAARARKRAGRRVSLPVPSMACR